MIPYTEKALELVRKFAKGAPCEIDFNKIEATMFHSHLEAIAKNSGLKEITEEVVKKYWFEIHNDLVVKRFKFGHLNLNQAKNCMVRPEKRENRIVCIHGGIEIIPITEQEAEFLEENFQKALKGLQ
jgi:hypothetical protein